MRAQMMVQNPGATMPLRFSLDVEVNTPDDVILANVLANSKLDREWVNSAPPHGKLAIICGSGPSLADSKDEIICAMRDGGEIFALNAAARFLESRFELRPTFQVIMDAQPQTASLIGPACHHLVASQADPSVFAALPDAKLWHATLGNRLVDEQPGFPAARGPYCLVGSGITVGVTSLALCYALGYRRFAVFGMDSSHREGASHVLEQPINAGDPLTFVDFNGKRYLASLVMKMQARAFVDRANALVAAGCSVRVRGSGLLPDMWNAPRLSEREKYERMWEIEEYRAGSPGELAVDDFIACTQSLGTVLDLGCGPGRASVRLAQAGFDPILLDIAGNCRDPEAEGLPFLCHDMRDPIPAAADYGLCCDVMEHVPPEGVASVLRNILASVGHCYFRICTAFENFGDEIGQVLHMTVRPASWWRAQLEAAGASILRSASTETDAVFYVRTQTLGGD